MELGFDCYIRERKRERQKNKNKNIVNEGLRFFIIYYSYLS